MANVQSVFRAVWWWNILPHWFHCWAAIWPFYPIFQRAARPPRRPLAAVASITEATRWPKRNSWDMHTGSSHWEANNGARDPPLLSNWSLLLCFLCLASQTKTWKIEKKFFKMENKKMFAAATVHFALGCIDSSLPSTASISSFIHWKFRLKPS